MLLCSTSKPQLFGLVPIPQEAALVFPLFIVELFLCFLIVKSEAKANDFLPLLVDMKHLHTYN